MQRGIAENAYLSKWAGGLGGSGRRYAVPVRTLLAPMVKAKA